LAVEARDGPPPERRPADPRDFNGFVTTTVDDVVGALYAMTGDLGRAHECVQEAYARAWLHWDRLSRQPDRLGRVRVAAWRLAAGRWRRALAWMRPRPGDGSPAAALRGSPGPSADSAAAAALRSISPRLRRAVVLHHVAGLGVEEIAQETGVAPGTARARLTRGRAALGAALTGPDRAAERRDGDGDGDGLDRTLKKLAADGAEQAPISAADVYLTAHRIRRRRTGRTTAASFAAVVVLGGVGFAALPRLAPVPELEIHPSVPRGPSAPAPSPAPSPTAPSATSVALPPPAPAPEPERTRSSARPTSAPPAPAAPTEVLRSALIRQVELEGHFIRRDWTISTYDGEAGGPMPVCQQAPFSSLAAEQTLTRDFSGPQQPLVARSAVARFPGEAEARAAAATLEEWASGCAAHLAGTGSRYEHLAQHEYPPVAADGGAGRAYAMTLDDVPGDNDRVFHYLAFGQRGNAVTLIALTHGGQDSNFEGEGEPIVPLLRIALGKMGPFDR
jgi:RNA polymerase sigma-70 factor (ECF subfamily)